MTDAAQACHAYLIDAIAGDLERAIANLGYPVGMGIAPHPDLCTRAARNIIDKIGDRALELLAERVAGRPVGARP